MMGWPLPSRHLGAKVLAIFCLIWLSILAGAVWHNQTTLPRYKMKIAELEEKVDRLIVLAGDKIAKDGLAKGKGK